MCNFETNHLRDILYLHCRTNSYGKQCKRLTRPSSYLLVSEMFVPMKSLNSLYFPLFFAVTFHSRDSAEVLFVDDVSHSIASTTAVLA